MSHPQTYSQALAENRRLAILRLLKESSGTANESVLHIGVEQLGFRNDPRSVIREDLAFMVKIGLLTDEWFNDVMVVTISRRGLDVAEGRITVSGVKKPGIGE